MIEGIFMEFLKKLDEKQLKEQIEDIALITDPLGRELIKRAASLNSPIALEDLPTIENGLGDEALDRLYRLEKIGVFKSSLFPVNGRTERVFSITDFGKKMAPSD